MKMNAFYFSVYVLVCLLTPRIHAAESLGDPFEGNKLQNKNWKWSDEPKEWDIGKTKSGWLYIKGERNRNLWGDDTTNRLYQEHNGDFDIATHLIMDYKDASTVMGPAAYSSKIKDRKNRPGEWVTLKLWGRGGGDKNAVIQYQKREFDGGEGLVGTHPGFLDPMGEIDLYMRMKRKGDTFTAWWKRKTKDKWEKVGETEHKFPDPIEVSIYSGIADAGGEMDSYYEYFEDLTNPFSISAGERLSVIWGALKQLK